MACMMDRCCWFGELGAAVSEVGEEGFWEEEELPAAVPVELGPLEDSLTVAECNVLEWFRCALSRVCSAPSPRRGSWPGGAITASTELGWRREAQSRVWMVSKTKM